MKSLSMAAIAAALLAASASTQAAAPPFNPAALLSAANLNSAGLSTLPINILPRLPPVPFLTNSDGFVTLPSLSGEGSPLSGLEQIIVSAGGITPKGPGRLPDPSTLISSTIDQVIVSAGGITPKGPGRLPDPTALIVSLTRTGRQN